MIDLRAGHVLDVLPQMKAEGVKVRCVVTSPPYWGLRAYGTEPQIWANGHDLCIEHEWQSESIKRSGGYSDKSTLAGFTSPNTKGRQMNESGVVANRDTCSTCGAWRGELGLEPTPELYVEHLVQVFRAVRDVLADDGTLWVNLGDSYSGTGGQGHQAGNLVPSGFQQKSSAARAGSLSQFNPSRGIAGGASPHKTTNTGVKQKDLIGVPWRVAFALQADGWYLRSDIIWHKPNPMPESVRDRPTKSHEYIFLLSKSPKYYYDADAVREPLSEATIADKRNGSGRHTHKNTKYNEGEHPDLPSWYRGKTFVNPQRGRNRRSVWTVTTKPYKGAHFATFSPELIEPCILAGSAVGDIVLDPFGGSGTVAEVALKHGRDAILIELKPDYVELQKKRLEGVQAALS